jgi:flagellar assembly factor FliW
LVFVCLEEVWQHFIHQPWRQQKTKLLIILRYNLIWFDILINLEIDRTQIYIILGQPKKLKYNFRITEYYWNLLDIYF